MTIDPQTPIIVGVGQAVSHWDGALNDHVPSPLSLQIEAASKALDDCAAGQSFARHIDQVYVLRSMADSISQSLHPFGRCDNPPGTLANALGISAQRLVYSAVGGDMPQTLVNEACQSIFAGQASAVLLAGSEATAALKLALKSKNRLDWSYSVGGDFEDRGLGPDLLTAEEIVNGLGAPTQTYPAFEHALRRRMGMDRASYRTMISELWAGFSQVAATHAYAQFPKALSAEFLSQPSPENYPVADPYLKWHVAQDAVNQGAAIILTSVGVAIEAGIAPEKWVFLHGHSSLRDCAVTDRPDLSRSRVIEQSLAIALDMAGKTPDKISLFDLYSCFPCAVLLAAEALHIDWRQVACTVTGGLPFFGGAGNNYSMHAIATITEKLRADPGAFGLVLANGGFLSKESVGIYSTQPTAWQKSRDEQAQAGIDKVAAPQLLTAASAAKVETYTVTFTKGSPSRGYVIASTNEGRVLARVRTAHRATLSSLLADDPIGRSVNIIHEKGVNYMEAPNPLDTPASDQGLPAREFSNILVERRGHVLEVTLNRPDAMNALYSAIHYELHEVWDSFQADPDLWVAIITGAGDRAFCSGNDLKVTAKGGDMSIPKTGFAGLCSRYDRTKPIIAAINGVAMGGGLEIVLSCDLAIAEEHAKMALPEVKVGLYAAAGGVQRLTRQIGRKAAMELILTGRTFMADEALRLGIINSVVPSGSALESARALADQIIQNSPTAVQASKEALNRLEEVENLEAALSHNTGIFARLMKTSDCREGVTAFAEKRKPNWTGK